MEGVTSFRAAESSKIYATRRRNCYFSQVKHLRFGGGNKGPWKELSLEGKGQVTIVCSKSVFTEKDYDSRSGTHVPIVHHSAWYLIETQEMTRFLISAPSLTNV